MGLTLTEAGLREPLRVALAERTRVRAPHGAGKASAVLLPLFEEAGEARVWLVRRASTLRSHSGQVAFPGGKRDAEDESLLTTALREAEEEIGLARSEVDVLGALDDVVTITGYSVTPFVAWVRPGVALTPSPAEVARLFSAPLSTFLAERTGTFPRLGWAVDGELVWGATALIASSLMLVARSIVSPAA